MKGAIIGDIIGSAYIGNNQLTTDIQLFNPTSAYTDDTILTLATADAFLHKKSYSQALKEWTQKFPMAGYNPAFLEWVLTEKETTYLSQSNGAARRISPIGYGATSLEEAMSEAEKSTIVTHNYLPKIKASKATAAGIYLLKTGSSKEEVRKFITNTFGYDLDKPLHQFQSEIDHLLPSQTPVPAAFRAFLDSSDFESAIRIAVSIGGPSNTIASIAGALAYAYYKHIPKSIIRKALHRLTKDMKNLIVEFEEKYFPESESKHALLAIEI